MTTTTPTTWADHGAVTLAPVFNSTDWQALEREAQSLHSSAFERVNPVSRLTPRREGSLVGPQRCRAHQGGPVLKSMVMRRELVHTVREATGMPLLALTRWGFKYYTVGDYMGVHRDDFRCTVTISFGVSGDLGEMGWLPDLRDASNEHVIGQLGADTVFPNAGRMMPIGLHELQAFDGYNIPHWRPTYQHAYGVLGTVCFVNLAD